MVVDGVQTKEDNYEWEPLGQATTATTLFASLASTLAGDSAQPLPHQCGPHRDMAMWQTRRLCGRWLAARRLHAGITDARVADRTGVDAKTLRLLEIGLADTLAREDEQWARLAVMLADADHDADLVMTVVQGALGNCDRFTENALERVADDLRTIAKEAATI